MKDELKQELENARVKYQASLQMSSFEGEVQWSRYNAMLLVNTIFIALIGFSYSNEFEKSVLSNSYFRIISPLLGLLLCLLWYFMTQRGHMWMTHWIEEARKIEEEIPSKTNPVNAGKELKSKIGGGVTINASYIVITIFAVIYTAILLANKF